MDKLDRDPDDDEVSVAAFRRVLAQDDELTSASARRGH